MMEDTACSKYMSTDVYWGYLHEVGIEYVDSEGGLMGRTYVRHVFLIRPRDGM